jgi:hypothetical protein
MDLGTFLIVLILFGLASYIIEKIWGVNPYKVYLGVGAITLFFSLLYVIWPVMNPPYNVNLSINRLTTWFVNFLPGAIIGDFAGIIIGKFTGDKK